MSTDTIGPDGPPLSTEGWENGVRFLGEVELRQTIAQLRKDLVTVGQQRDLWRDLYGYEAREREVAEQNALDLAAELEAMRATNPQLAEAAGHIAAAYELTKGWAT